MISCPPAVLVESYCAKPTSPPRLIMLVRQSWTTFLFFFSHSVSRVFAR